MGGAVRVFGIGADGWPGLSERVRSAILKAEVVLGGDRQLSLLPPAAGQVREPWPSPLRDLLPELLRRHDGRTVVALASGDPLLSGIGTTLLELLGPDAVVVEPAVSSVALARARMGWPAESVEVVSVVGRDAHAVLRGLAPGHRMIVLSSDADTPTEIARLLVESGYGSTAMTVLGHLGSTDETRADGTAGTWSAKVPRLNVVALSLVGPVVGPLTGGLPDAAYDHDGQLTKRDQRASALARLAAQPGQLLWDVGAGAGSVGIEWMRTHPTCRAIAVEEDVDRADRIAANARRLGVPALDVRPGHAPEALTGLPAPDAVFIGGGATDPGVVDACLGALRPGGRLVVHGVTLETETLLAGCYAAHGGELSRLHFEYAEPLGTFVGWRPTRQVTQWSVQR